MDKLDEGDDNVKLVRQYIQQAKEEYSAEDYKKSLVDIMLMYATKVLKR